MEKHAVCVSVMLLLMLAQSESSPMKPCCTEYQQRPIAVRRLKHYTIQEVTHYCNIKAIIFKTKLNKLVCGNPDSEWVQLAKETVPQLRRRLKKST